MAVKKARARDCAGNPCFYCKRPMLGTEHFKTVDAYTRGRVASEEHRIPASVGGPRDSHNIVICCTRCNNIRGNLNADIFDEYAKIILRKYPNAPTVYLRACLRQYIESLAEVAIKNKRAARKALSVALLTLADDLKRVDWTPPDD